LNPPKRIQSKGGRGRARKSEKRGEGEGEGEGLHVCVCEARIFERKDFMGQRFWYGMILLAE
jgi:hypothetical protein